MSLPIENRQYTTMTCFRFLSFFLYAFLFETKNNTTLLNWHSGIRILKKAFVLFNFNYFVNVKNRNIY